MSEEINEYVATSCALRFACSGQVIALNHIDISMNH